MQAQFRNRNLPIRHAQLPPEAHEIPAPLRLAIIRQATGDHRLNTLPLLNVAESVSKARQSHGRTVPTVLTCKPSEVIPLGVLRAGVKLLVDGPAVDSLPMPATKESSPRTRPRCG